jgi:hypothetical protein
MTAFIISTATISKGFLYKNLNNYQSTTELPTKGQYYSKYSMIKTGVRVRRVEKTLRNGGCRNYESSHIFIFRLFQKRVVRTTFVIYVLLAMRHMIISF